MNKGKTGSRQRRRRRTILWEMQDVACEMQNVVLKAECKCCARERHFLRRFQRYANGALKAPMAASSSLCLIKFTDGAGPHLAQHP